MRNLSITAIVVGGLVQAVLNSVAGGGIGWLIFKLYFKFCKIGGPDVPIEELMFHVQILRFILLIFYWSYSVIMYILGGFIATQIAKKNEIMNAICTIYPLIIYIVLEASSKDFSKFFNEHPFNGTVDGPLNALFTALVACAFGGYIGMRRNLRRRGPSATE